MVASAEGVAGNSDVEKVRCVGGCMWARHCKLPSGPEPMATPQLVRMSCPMQH